MSLYLPTCSLTPCTKKMQAAGITRSLGIQELWEGVIACRHGGIGVKEIEGVGDSLEFVTLRTSIPPCPQRTV